MYERGWRCFFWNANAREWNANVREWLRAPIRAYSRYHSRKFAFKKTAGIHAAIRGNSRSKTCASQRLRAPIRVHSRYHSRKFAFQKTAGIRAPIRATIRENSRSKKPQPSARPFAEIRVPKKTS
jgi:hypothetical protein